MSRPEEVRNGDCIFKPKMLDWSIQQFISVHTLFPLFGVFMTIQRNTGMHPQ